MPKKIKPKLVRKYIDGRGGQCPYCEGTEIGGGLFDAMDGMAWQVITCPDCDKQWQDIYELHAIDPGNEEGVFGDKFIEPVPPPLHRLIQDLADIVECFLILHPDVEDEPDLVPDLVGLARKARRQLSTRGVANHNNF